MPGRAGSAAKPESAWPSWFRELVVVAFAEDLARLVMNRRLAEEMHAQAFGTPSENGRGGLFAAALEEDGRAAPQRTLGYDDAGPLVEARFGGGWAGRLFDGRGGFVVVLGDPSGAVH